VAALALPSRRTPWGDARFFVGLLLVAASVAGVWFVVTAARQSSPVVVAAHTIVAGDVIADADLRTTEAAFGSDGAAYLAPGDLEPGSVATRTIAAGEFVPTSAIGDAASVRVTTVVVRSTTAVPGAVERGTVVELWAAPPLERGTFGTPAILVADATVAAIGSDDSMIGSSAVTVELVIPRAQVAATLEALAAGSALSIVPAAVTR